METGQQHGVTLATKITISRILLIPVFVLAAVYYTLGVSAGRPNEALRWSAALVFLVACFTDALDGYVARRRNQRSRLGTLLDPVADKALLLTGLIMLTGPWSGAFNPHIPVWYVLMVFSRDIILAVGTAIIHVSVGHAVIEPRWSGKASTLFQMAIIAWVLIGLPKHLFDWVIGAATLCTLVSAAQYVIDGVRQLEKAHPHEPLPSH